MPQSKRQKQLSALARREANKEQHTFFANISSGVHTSAHYQRKANIAARDVDNLRRKLGMPESTSAE